MTTRASSGSWLGLAAGTTAFVLVLASLGGWNLPLVVACVLGMIFLHELGHFATAKWSGMQVTEFFVGFGPRVFSVTRGETEYGVKLLPLGGYVKITGMTMLEEVDPAVETRSFRASTFPRRVIVASAGSAVHLLLALVLAWSALVFVGVSNPREAAVAGFSNWTNYAATPAQVAGLRTGDVITAVDGHPVTSVTALITTIHARSGAATRLTVRRGDHARTVVVTPVDGRHVSSEGATLAPANGPATGFIGVALESPLTPVAPTTAVGRSFGVVRSSIAASVSSLAHVFSPHSLSSLFSQALTTAAGGTGSGGSAASSRPLSSVGVVRLAVQSANAGVGPLLAILIEINVFVGVFNYLPLLPLDGGHVAVALYERLRSRRGRRYVANVAKMTPLVYGFLGLLAFLFVTTVVLDLGHPLSNPFH